MTRKECSTWNKGINKKILSGYIENCIKSPNYICDYDGAENVISVKTDILYADSKTVYTMIVNAVTGNIKIVDKNGNEDGKLERQYSLMYGSNIIESY